MSNATPLTDAINALTRYANETTGASDTTLSDAVGTLVAGYGGGGGWTLDGIATNAEPNGDVVLGNSVTSIGVNAFAYKPITSISGSRVTAIGNYAFINCTSLSTVNFPNLSSLGDGVFQQSGIEEFISESNTITAKANLFRDCSKLKRVVMMTNGNNSANYWVQNCPLLEEIICPNSNAMSVNGLGFKNDNSIRLIDYGRTSSSYYASLPNTAPLDTLIYRKNNGLVTMSSNDANTLKALPAFTDGTGFNVYIPKVYYDHLGDGTNLDYQNATNWSTLYATGYLTFRQIEGSIYEDVYWWMTA